MSFREYTAIGKVFQHYWKTYGGSLSVLRSPYLHFAAAVTLLSWGAWTKFAWWELPLNVLPDLLGFSIGGFAIFLAFGDEDFRKAIAGRDDGENRESSYVRISATFMHFIFVQAVALVVVLVLRSQPLAGVSIPPGIGAVLDMGRRVAWFAGYLLFIYALVLALATSVAIYRLARLYDKHISLVRREDATRPKPCQQHACIGSAPPLLANTAEPERPAAAQETVVKKPAKKRNNRRKRTS